MCAFMDVTSWILFIQQLLLQNLAFIENEMKHSSEMKTSSNRVLMSRRAKFNGLKGLRIMGCGVVGEGQRTSWKNKRLLCYVNGREANWWSICEQRGKRTQELAVCSAATACAKKCATLRVFCDRKLTSWSSARAEFLKQLSRDSQPKALYISL